MRWLKLAVYLGLVYVVLSLSLPRAAVWTRLALGPAGWVPDPPHPLVWVPIAAFTMLFLLALVADVGFGLWKLPNALSGAMVAAFGAAVIGLHAEERGRLSFVPPALSASPASRLAAKLEEMKADLGDHYRLHRSFPISMEELEEAGAAAGRKPAPYLYTGLRSRPPALEIHAGAAGPITEIDEDVRPGTILYAVSDDGQAYWLTAVAGEGAPAGPRLLRGAGGRPFVMSNVPRRPPM